MNNQKNNQSSYLNYLGLGEEVYLPVRPIFFHKIWTAIDFFFKRFYF